MLSPHAQALLQKINDRTAVIGVVGLGYVGLPMARALHDAGFRVSGFDIDTQKVTHLRAGTAYLKHVGQDLYDALKASPRFTPTAEPSDLARCDAIILCVPTPLGKHQEPDLSYVRASTEMVAQTLRPGCLVSLESTSYPGTTREVCLPILEQRGFKCGDDLFVVFSPEREDPGRRGVSTRTIPRLVGALDPASGEIGAALYRAAVEQVTLVDSAEIAEAAKLLENIYRAVNIALVNELKPVLTAMGIDIWSVIRAASTKPFGFQPFYPGPGLGGHCIPIDPFYLTWKAREHGQVTRFIELAGEINSRMPRYVVSRIIEALNEDGRAVRGSRILLIGMAYKPDIDDVRETPAAEIIELLGRRGAIVGYHDPLIPEFPGMRRYDFEMASTPLTPDSLRAADAVVIVTNHSAVDYTLIARHARLVVDTRDAMRGVPSPAARIVKA